MFQSLHSIYKLIIFLIIVQVPVVHRFCLQDSMYAATTLLDLIFLKKTFSQCLSRAFVYAVKRAFTMCAFCDTHLWKLCIVYITRRWQLQHLQFVYFVKQVTGPLLYVFILTCMWQHHYSLCLLCCTFRNGVFCDTQVAAP